MVDDSARGIEITPFLNALTTALVKAIENKKPLEHYLNIWNEPYAEYFDTLDASLFLTEIVDELEAATRKNANE
jgi:hypothetical protein